MTEPLPPDPFLNTDMLPMAKTAYDMFTAYQASGFTESQALQITIALIIALVTNAPAKRDAS